MELDHLISVCTNVWDYNVGPAMEKAGHTWHTREALCRQSLQSCTGEWRGTFDTYRCHTVYTPTHSLKAGL